MMDRIFKRLFQSDPTRPMTIEEYERARPIVSCAALTIGSFIGIAIVAAVNTVLEVLR